MAATNAGPHIALIGCGKWGRNILRDLLALNCAVSVADHREENRAMAREKGAVRAVADLADLPAAVDGVVVAVQSTRHAAVIESQLHRGVPIFTEKPLTTDPASARALATAAPDRIFVMHKWRYHPGIEMLREIAATGELGPTHGLRLTQVAWGNPHADCDVVWNLAPHVLSMVLEIFGAIPPIASAVADRDAAGNAVGLVAQLGSAERWAVLEISARSAENIRQFRLHARDGVAVLAESLADHMQILRGGTDVKTPTIERRPISTEWPLLRELRAFVEFIGGGPAPKSSAIEGARIVETIARMRQIAGLDPAPPTEPIA